MPVEAREAFDDTLRERFARTNPYGGIELERELRAVLDEGPLAELRETVEAVAETFGQADGEEKTRSPDRSETTPVQYRIAEDVRASIMELAERSDYRSAGAFVGDVMLTYAVEGGIVGRLTEKLDRVRKTAEREHDSEIDTKERRTIAIADELADTVQFDLRDFDRAVDQGPRGIDAGAYAKREYLPRVLDELGFVWSPSEAETFVDPDIVEAPDYRDPTAKPTILMDEADRQLALKFEAYRNAVSTWERPASFTLTDAIDALGGRVSRQTVRPLLREIAEESPGFQYTDSKEEPLLSVRRDEVKNAREANSDLFPKDPSDETSDSEQSIDETDRHWVDDAARRVLSFCEKADFTLEDVPPQVIGNKIVRAQNPELPSDEYCDDSAFDSVTEAEHDLVWKRLEEIDTEDPIGDIDASMDTLAANERGLTTDGGHRR